MSEQIYVDEEEGVYAGDQNEEGGQDDGYDCYDDLGPGVGAGMWRGG